jgi:hypothetical protein
MRATTSVALSILLLTLGVPVVAGQSPSAVRAVGTSVADPSSKEGMTAEQARERLTDLLFSDTIDRIDFQATTFEEGTALVDASIDMIMEMGLPLLGDTRDVVNRGAEIIRALNSSKAQGLYMTFDSDKQAIYVRDPNEARMLGDLVGTTMSILHEEFGSGISYQEKAKSLFNKVRVDTEDTATMLQLHMETIDHVKGLSSKERMPYFR